MLETFAPLPVKAICAFIYSNEEVYSQTKKILERKYGVIDFESRRINFIHTPYYEPEMGKPLYRRFISFKKLRKADKFVDMKLFCIKLEKKYAKDNKRIVNIDPGYINDAKLVLTTTKDFAHRIYLSKGIFAEVTLVYKDKTFQDLPTTFPDYRTPEYKEILRAIKSNYHNQLKPHK